MSASCRERYRRALLDDLRNLSRAINYRLCVGQLCPYVTGAPDSGVRLNESDPHNTDSVFVAIDTDALTDAITFTTDKSTVSSLALFNSSMDCIDAS